MRHGAGPNQEVGGFSLAQTKQVFSMVATGPPRRLNETTLNANEAPVSVVAQAVTLRSRTLFFYEDSYEADLSWWAY